MNTGPLIESALSGLTFNGVSVPVAHDKYTGQAKTYCQYYKVIDQPESFADDEPIFGNDYDAIDVYCTKSDFYSLIEDIKSRLKASDFSITDVTNGLYDSNSSLHHLVIDISHED
jgi:hypothetical protein